MTAFMGMVGSGDFSAEERPKNWRQKILQLYPNGDAPLTAIMSKMSSESTDDPEFNWFEKLLATQAGATTGIYTDSSLTTAYTSGAIVGTVVYLKTGIDIADQVRPGHQILMRDDLDLTKDINGKVLERLSNGDNSVLTVQCLEAERVSGDLADANRVLIVGSINSEGGDMPQAISYSPTPLKNQTQIFRTPLSITRTARKTKLRTGDKYNEMKREALELHGLEMEKNTLYSVPTVRQGMNGKPERTTAGIIYWIRNNDGLEDSFTTSTYVTAGASWVAEGREWLDEICRRIFRFGPRERLAFVGDKALKAIQDLVRADPQGNYSISAETVSYGLSVTKWHTPFGVLNMMIHPLFSYEPSTQGSMLLLVPQYMKLRYIDDTTFFKDGDQQNTGHSRRDGTDEEFLTEAGYEFHHGRTFGFIHGFGSDNTL